MDNSKELLKVSKKSRYKGIDRFKTALNFAFAAHDGQKRKLSNLPYIVHPMECGLIAMSLIDDLYTYDENNEDYMDVICASILHDTIEDTDATEDEIEIIFGTNVLNYVNDDTEDKMLEMNPEDSWRMRKENSLRHLRDHATREGKILWMCDKLSNTRSMFNAYVKHGDKMWEYFNQKDKKEQKWYYDSIEEYLKDLSDTGAYQEFVLLKNYIFREV